MNGVVFSDVLMLFVSWLLSWIESFSPEKISHAADVNAQWKTLNVYIQKEEAWKLNSGEYKTNIKRSLIKDHRIGCYKSVQSCHHHKIRFWILSRSAQSCHHKKIRFWMLSRSVESLTTSKDHKLWKLSRSVEWCTISEHQKFTPSKDHRL